MLFFMKLLCHFQRTFTNIRPSSHVLQALLHHNQKLLFQAPAQMHHVRPTHPSPILIFHNPKHPCPILFPHRLLIQPLISPHPHTTFNPLIPSPSIPSSHPLHCAVQLGHTNRRPTLLTTYALSPPSSLPYPPHGALILFNLFFLILAFHLLISTTSYLFPLSLSRQVTRRLHNTRVGETP